MDGPTRPTPPPQSDVSAMATELRELVQRLRAQPDVQAAQTARLAEANRQQVGLLQEIRDGLRAMAARDDSMLAEMREQRLLEERMIAQNRIDTLEAAKRAKGDGAGDGAGKPELLLRSGDIFGDLAALALGFIAFATSFKAAADGARETLKRADQAIQGFLGQIWAVSKGVTGLAHGVAIVAGAIAFAIIRPIELLLRAVSKIPVFGAIVKPIMFTFKILRGFISGLADFFQVLLTPLRIAVRGLQAFGRFSGLISVLLIAFDGIYAGYKEFQKGSDAITILGASIWGAIESIKNTVVGIWKLINWVAVKVAGWFGFADEVRGAFNVINGAFSTLWTAIESIKSLGDLKDVLIDIWSNQTLMGQALQIAFEAGKVVGSWINGLIKSFGDLSGLIDRIWQASMAPWRLIQAVGSGLGDAISGFLGFFGELLSFFDRVFADTKEKILATNLPGIGNIGTALQLGSAVGNYAKSEIETAMTGRSKFLAPAIEPRQTLMGKTLQEARMRADKTKGATVIMAPSVMDNSSVSQSSVKQVIAMPMTPGNPREPALSWR